MTPTPFATARQANPSVVPGNLRGAAVITPWKKPPGVRAASALRPHLAADVANPPLTYRGGAVERVGSVNYSIFWKPAGFSTSANYQTLINRYFQDIGGSPFYGLLTQYSDGGGSIVNSSALGGTWTDLTAYPSNAPTYPSNTLIDSNIQQSVVRAMTANNWWPAAGVNANFFVYTAIGEESCVDPFTCSNNYFCAYHSNFAVTHGTTLDIKYANHPYDGNHLGGCGVPTSPNNDVDADSEINSTSHEHFEMVTDPDPTTNTAWLDANGNEIGDKCNSTFGTLDGQGADVSLNGHPYILQQEWNNAVAGCASSLVPPATPTPTATVPTSTPVATSTPVPTSTPAATVTPAPPVIQDIAMLAAPQRLVDTRTQGQPISAGQSLCFSVAGQGGIPSTAAGVVLNVTAVGYADFGWLTLYPAGQPVPTTSTLNFDIHEYAIANGAIVKLGAGLQVCVAAGRSASHVVLDVTGYLPGATGQLQLLAQPQRLVDTRTAGGALSAGSSRCFAIGGLSGIPANAAAVMVNVTAVGYSKNGWLSLFPNGQGVPATSTVNFDSTEYAIANSAVMGLGTSGQLCVNAGNSSSHVIIDATGYLANGAGSQITMLASPQRVVDTRSSGGPILASQSRCFTLGGQSGVPSTAASVILNVAAVGYADFGWGTLYPSGQVIPSTSTLNFDSHEYAIANGAIVKLGPGGQMCVAAGRSATQLILDVAGYVSP